jgi:hypothetical protein
MAGLVPAISIRMARCPQSRSPGQAPGDDTATVLARISVVGYDFAKKNTNAEKGELT